ncbi:MAG: PspC domain-containing protein [Chitinophagaceae bacterium]|nr:PspC domain-containing protein [Chitinophagaceae bacterium]MBL0131669.1 PspC domain-containing protein [Chitinophagaceae bacterium]
MKKIININLSGRVIPIEDAAYEKLQAYVESLRRYFVNEESRDEIINDIESRIAELMNEKVRKSSAAITETDVQEIITSMGTVEDFEAVDSETVTAGANVTSQQSTQQNYTNTGTTKPRGRLYRDSNDKFIGGVCSGIASYLNVDPAVIRLLFAIIGFGTGIGFLAYIILWIVLPPKDLEGFSGKRLYRNPDDKIIGGVAGGLAAYFNKKATGLRLIFAAPLLLNILISILGRMSWRTDFDLALNIGFGSITGTFILTYIILWIVLPEANSDYEKMEMRGEKVDVNRIRQNVKEGMGNMKEKMKGWGEEVKESAQNISNKAKEFAGTKGKAMVSEFNESARRRRNGLGHAIGVIFKVFFLFIAGTIAFALFVSLIALLFGGVAWWPINNFLWTSKWQQIYAWGTLIFFLVIPLIGFITWIIRRIIRVKSRNNYLSWTFGGLWVIGWLAVVLLGSSIARDFREYEHTETPMTINQPVNGKMLVAVSQPVLEYTGRFDWMNDDGEGWDLSSDTLKLSTVRFDIKASADDAYHVAIKKYSFGRTEDEAIDRAGKIQYTVNSRDSILDLGNGYAIGKENKFRGQQVEIEIQVPVGKKIRFDESVDDKLNSVNVKVRKSYRRNRVVGIDINDNKSFRYRPGIDYIMELNGRLKDVNDTGATAEPAGNYRYPGTDSAVKNEIQQQIEEEKRKQDERNKESERKIKELQNKQKGSGAKATDLKKKINPDNEGETFAGGPSPVSSLVQWF